MAFPASPVNDATHTIDGVVWTYKTADNRWHRLPTAHNDVRWVEPHFHPPWTQADGSIFMQKYGAPWRARGDFGTAWGMFDNSSRIIQDHQINVSDISYGTNWEQFRLIRIRHGLTPLAVRSTPMIVFNFVNGGEMNGVVRVSRIIRWGTGGELNTHIPTDNKVHMAGQLRQNRRHTLTMDIPQPGRTGWKSIYATLEGRRSSNDSGQLWYLWFEIRHSSPIKGARFTTDLNEKWNHGVDVMGMK